MADNFEQATEGGFSTEETIGGVIDGGESIGGTPEKETFVPENPTQNWTTENWATMEKDNVTGGSDLFQPVTGGVSSRTLPKSFSPTITLATGETIGDLPLENDSVMEEAIMGERFVRLHFTLDEFMEFPVGSYLYFPTKPENTSSADAAHNLFTMYDAAEVNKKNDYQYEYVLMFLSYQSAFARWAMTDADYIIYDRYPNYPFYYSRIPAADFSLTGKPIDHISKVVAALRINRQSFEVGECIDADEKTITYGSMTIMEALNAIAKAFDSEWYLSGWSVGLQRRRLNVFQPLSLSYGKGNGLLSGVRRTRGDKSPIRTLYITGTERNIIKKDYGASRLCIPQGTTKGVPPVDRPIFTGSIDYDGTYTELEEGYDPTKKCFSAVVGQAGETKNSFIKDNWYEAASYGVDGFFSDDDIYPCKTHEATAVLYQYRAADFVDYDTLVTQYPVLADTESEEWDKVSVAVCDSSNDIDYDKQQIEGEAMTITFQTGMMAGKQFNVRHYYHDAVGTRQGRRFLIERSNVDGFLMPIPPFVPSVGDKFAVFGVKMDKSYYEEAEIRLVKAAIKYMYENNRQTYSMDATIDGVWAAKDWSRMSRRLCLCGSISFTDPSFQPEPLSLRVTKISFPLNWLCQPSAEFTNDYRNLVRRLRKTEARVTNARMDRQNEENATRLARTEASMRQNDGVTKVAGTTTYAGVNDTMVVDESTSTSPVTILLPPAPRVGQRCSVVKKSQTHALVVSSLTGEGGALTPSGTTPTIPSGSKGAFDCVYDGSGWVCTNV